MNIFSAVSPILNAKTASVRLEISANPNNAEEMAVIIKPVVGPVPNNAPETLVQLVSALALPIKVIGHPTIIESEVVAAIQQQSGHRQSWAEQVAQIEANLQNAQPKAQASKPAKKAEPATTTEPAPNVAGEKEPVNAEADDNFSLEL